ncbi:MAG: DUF4340 domain-containing protein [Pseudomonadota bacterium]|nr:DUF4340 domain-containing protein [Pseudomonadota bacterium]
MNAKNISILAIITLVVVGLTFYIVLQQQRFVADTPAQKQAFPKLAGALDKVAMIEVKTPEKNEFTLVRGEEDWVLKEKYDYPVALEKVRKLLLGFAQLELLEPKTQNPKLYSKIGVQAVSEANADSVLVTLKDSAGDALESLIIGHDQIAKTDSTLKEIYVRKPDEQQSWLALGLLPVDKKPIDWLDKEIVNLEAEKIRQVRITHAAGEQALIFKDSPDDEQFKLAELPEDSKAKTYVLRQIASTLSHLNLEDVSVPSEIKFDEEVTTAIFTAFNGLEITLQLVEQDGKHYAQLNADLIEAYQEDTEEVEDAEAADDTEEEETEAELKERVLSLNKRFNNWVFVLPSYKATNITQSPQDLIEAVKEEAEAEAIKGGDGANQLFEFGSPSTAVVP